MVQSPKLNIINLHISSSQQAFKVGTSTVYLFKDELTAIPKTKYFAPSYIGW